MAAICCGVLFAAPVARAAGVTIDASVKTHQGAASTSITSGPLTTTAGNDLIEAFITSDGPSNSGGESFSSVTGGGLTWSLRERINSQPGTAEIWQAVASSPLSGMTVTAKRSSGSWQGSIVVVAFSGANTGVNGAVASANATTGAPSVSLRTTEPDSWVWAVGNDWDNATDRTAGAGQTIFDQDLTSSGDTYWVQSQAAPGNPAGTSVTLNDTAPTTDRWDYAAIEIPAASPDTQPPSTPTNLKASAVNSNQVSLTWSTSTDNVGVTGYYVLRNGSEIGTATGPSYVDNGVSPSTPYSYTVEAFDAAGNVSQPSSPAAVTTPPASTNPPVISNVAATNITSTAATITWTTDVPSSSQVLYGMSASYGQSTTLDKTQVTSHSQTVSGLLPGDTYHFAVQSTGSANNTATSTDNTFTTLATDVTLPDLQVEVPTGAISIGTNGSTGNRQLQFTHITWDSGTGPFEMDPNYNASTGIATFTQAIYNSPSPGVWNFDHSVPIEAPGIYDPSTGHFTFPLTKFTLNTVNSDGSIGTVVATSPKTDFCISGDTKVGGVPNTPSTSSPSLDCGDPTLPLGWSVGWGDEYDQTDPGQPIDLTNVPNGTYILRGVADPEHVFTESNTTNNVTDTELQIAGSSVTVLSQSTPVVTPPSVSVTNPSAGANVSGAVTLQASASTGAPASISSVQFLLDGQPIGNPVTSAPYTYNWTVGSTPLGSHLISARVTNSTGNMNTAAPVSVNVVSGGPPPPNTPTVSITNPVNTEVVSGTVPVAATASANLPIASVQFMLDGKPLGSPVTAAPYAVNWDTTKAAAGSHVLSATATDTAGDAGTSSNVTVTVQNPPPPMTCFVMQAHESVHGKGIVTTPSFGTALAGETLVAFVAADGPATAGAQQATVSGGGLTWTLVKRENAQLGDSEVWQATASSVIPSMTVSSSEADTGYSQDLTVIAMEGTKGVGASSAAAAVSGAPSVSLTTTAPNSLIFAVGNDWDNATARTLPSNWTMLDQWTSTSVGDDYWIQYTSDPVIAQGAAVAVADTAPTGDRWNLVAVELLDDPS